MTENSSALNPRRKVFLGLLLTTSTALMLIALFIPLLRDYLTPALTEGQVAERDFRSPEAITFESQVLTEQRRELAEQAVAPIYTTPAISIGRQQLEHLRAALAYITSVRADEFASPAQKLDDLAALVDVSLSQEMASMILESNDARWQTIQQEAIAALEKVMSGVIRPDSVEFTRRLVPSLVSLSLPEGQAAIAAELTSAFVAPNSQYSESLTEAAREEARQAVVPVTRSYAPGQTIVLRGEVLSADDIEALQQTGLAQPERRWQDLVSAASLVLLVVLFMLVYVRQRQQFLLEDMRSAVVVVVLFLTYLFSARLIIPSHTVLPYLFPLAAYSMTVTALFGAELAFVSAIPLTILIAYNLPYSLDLTLYYLVSCLFGALTLGSARRLLSFFWAGAAVSLSCAVVVLIYRLPSPTTDVMGLATLVAAALFNGMASASISILFQFLLAQFLGMTTPMQLMDLTRPDHPLLQDLLHDAPGTYQHSLQVANLAEQAAEVVGADPLLTRVGALYHDIGKTIDPIYFIENQPSGFPNPHNALIPDKSAQIIIKHVTDGLHLGNKHRLPRPVLNFIAEHHGTTVTRYQYIQAVKAAGGDEQQVDTAQFTYPGPRPQSRETAILMLADGCEARIRAERPIDEEQLHEMVREMIAARVSQGQLDDTNLTLRDLSEILESFTATLRGIYHPRVKYPQLEAPKALIAPEPQQPEVPVDLTVEADAS